MPPAVSPKKKKGAKSPRAPKSPGRAEEPSVVVGDDAAGAAAISSSARKWAEKQWVRAQDDASSRHAALEERIAYDRAIVPEELRARRAAGLLRARQITSWRIQDDDGHPLHIPELLLTKSATTRTKEELRILKGEPTEEMAKRLAEKAADEADTRSAKEIIEAMHERGDGIFESTALKTVAWPKSNEKPPAVLMPGQKPPKSRWPGRARNNPDRYSLSAATTV